MRAQYFPIITNQTENHNAMPLLMSAQALVLRDEVTLSAVREFESPALQFHSVRIDSSERIICSLFSGGAHGRPKSVFNRSERRNQNEREQKQRCKLSARAHRIFFSVP